MSKQEDLSKEEISVKVTKPEKSKKTSKKKHSSTDSDSDGAEHKSAKKRRNHKDRDDHNESRKREEMSSKSRRDEPERRRHSSEDDRGRMSHSDSDDHDKRHRSSSSRRHQRYWGRDDSESRSSRRNNDRYWNKYQAQDEDRSVGSRYYGDNFSRERRRDGRERDGKENYQNKRRHDSAENSERRDDRRPKTNRSRDRDNNEKAEAQPNQEENPPPPKAPRKVIDMLTSKTGGAYIPPARLRMMQAQITDKSSAAYQRISWEALKKSIHGHINKVNTGNIGIIVRELLKENVVRGRGLLCRSIIQAQAASITFTHVYAGLVAVINCKFPNVGELLLKRLIIQFKRGFKRNDKSICISAATFLAHLVNQRVAHEILALEILTLLVETPTDDSVEVAIAFLKECGSKLLEVSNKGILAIFEMLRNILHEGQLEKRVQYMIEVILQVRKENFKDHEAVISDLDLVGEEDQFTHLITLEDVTDPEDLLNVFKLDPDFEVNEGKYKALKEELLDEGSSDDESGSDSEEEDDSDAESESAKRAKEETIIDNTETNLVALRRTIYLTIHSSLDFEECAHKLMRMELKPGQEIELCHMFLDCCAEQRTYEKFYGLLSQRFCMINKIFIPPFQQIFRDTYETIHRLDINKLRNVAKFFAHLLFTDAISWEVLSLIRLNEEDTSSSSRIFIKILFQELSEYMGLTKLNDRVKDVTLQSAFDGLFPRDDPKNTRFAVNFFTSIGLGGLTDELREHLKAQSKLAAAANVVPPTPAVSKKVPSDSSSSNSSSSSSSSSSSDSSSESESSDEDDRKKSKKKSKQVKKKVSSKKAPPKKSSHSRKSRSPAISKHKRSRK